MEWDAVLVVWLPVAVVFVAIVFVARRQARGYAAHVERVSQINNQIVELNLKNHDIAARQLEALLEIKSLLENRKS